ncbi:MAG: hypothetical protein ACRDA6_04095 [Aeromonas veronii]
MKQKAPVEFIHVGFFDLICDAIFHYRQSKDASDSYSMNRNARASIISSSLSLECYANALLQDIDSSNYCFKDLDKMTPLSKIEIYFKMNGITKNIDYGDHKIQKINELIQVRNSYVHSKSRVIKTTINSPQDGGTHWILPMELDGEQYKSLAIPKSPMFWGDDSARSILEAILSFYKYMFDIFDKIKDKKSYLLMNRVCFDNVVMPNTFTEFDIELDNAEKLGLDIKFMKPE